MQVKIRPLQKEDALISYKWRNNPIIWKYTGSRPDKIITPEMETEWIENVLQRKNEKRFAIVADGIYVGNIYLTSIQNQKESEFHIFIGETDYWGKGVASIATKEVLSFAKSIKLKRIFLEVHQDNISAQRLYEKMGFVITQKNNPMWKMEKIL